MNKRILSRAQNSKTYAYINAIKRSLRETKKYFKNNNLDRIVVRLEPDESPRGKVLFSYIIDGFLLNPEDPIPNRHTNIWQSVKMAETFVELGYIVDVISWRNTSYTPKGDYSAFIDVRRNMERLAPMLNKDCVKIAHLDTSDIVFHNAAGSKRLYELQHRRGITLRQHRHEFPNHLIECSDYATTCGNDAVVKTFAYAGKKIFKLPSPCASTYKWIENKNWDKTRKNFLWFSSSGLVHKGLDLVLEVFSNLPNYHLTICAPLDKDKDFVQAYHNELRNTPNIETIGWVDIESEEFIEITARCIAVLHTSCSEAGAPSVKTCMHAGLIPIISYETGVDVENFGMTLKNCSVDEINNSIQYIGTLSTEELKTRARKSWEFARQNFTRENFSINYKEVISQILSVE